MLMPKKDRVKIYEYLFKEGVMVAQKNPHRPRHPNVPVPNLYVMKALQVCGVDSVITTINYL